MINRKLTYIIFPLLILVGFTACEKDRSPTLIVTVVDENEQPVADASVRVWPGIIIFDSTNTGSGNVDTNSVDQTMITDASGMATFEFEFSAVLDIDVIATDSSGAFLVGHSSVKLETVKQKEEENIFNETVVVE